jgi:hypothetical protein
MGDEFLDQLILPVDREPFPLDFEHKFSKGEADKMVTVRFDPRLQEFRLKGVYNTSDLFVGGNLLICEESLAGIVKLAEVADS